MEVEQISLLYNVLSSPSIKDRNLQDLAIETFWPDMNILQAETLLHGLFYLDSIEPQTEPPKQEELPN